MSLDETDVSTELRPTTPTTPPAAPASWQDAWRSALDRLEVDVDAAEDLLQQLHSGSIDVTAVPFPVWRAPVLPGRLPADYLDRARALHQRQLDVSERLSRAMVQTRSQSTALRKMARAEARPVFVDFAL